MEDETERLVVAVSVGAGCMLLFVAIVLAILFCRGRCNKKKMDDMDRNLVRDPSMLSDDRYSSRIEGSGVSPRSQRSHIFAKRDITSSDGSALSGFVYKPKHLDRLRNGKNGGKSKKEGQQNGAYVKNTVKSQRSARSLPVMAQVSNYGMEHSPAPPHLHYDPNQPTQYDFSIPKTRASRSLYDYDREVRGGRHNQRNTPHYNPAAMLGFQQTRLPSTEQISFASDGRFVAPEPSYNWQPAQPNVAQTQNNYFQQYQLRNSDLLRPTSGGSGGGGNLSPTQTAYQQYMNGTIQRVEYETQSPAEYGQTPGAYYPTINAVFDRNMASHVRS